MYLFMGRGIVELIICKPQKEDPYQEFWVSFGPFMGLIHIIGHGSSIHIPQAYCT